MNAAYMLGRILLPLVFLVAGIQKLMNIREIADMLAANKIPIPEEIVPYLGSIPKYEALGYLIAAIEIICGLMVLIGVAFGNTSAGFGVGGFLVIMGLAFFIKYELFELMRKELAEVKSGE